MALYLPGCRIVGLDAGAHSIKAVQLTTSLTNFKITGFLIKERQGSTWEDLAEDLRSITPEGPLQGDVFVTSFPSHKALFRTSELPFSQLDKIEAAIPYEAESIMISPLEEMAVDFTLLEGTSQGSSVIITCVQRELLQDYMDALREGGMVPDMIDIDALALARLMEEVKEERGIVLLDVGAEKISVNIFQKGGLRFTRSIPLEDGGGNGIEEIRPALEEVIFTMKAYLGAGGRPIEEVWLTGGGSRREGLDGYLEKEIGVKVNYPDFLKKFPSTVTLPEEANMMGGVALGLALRGLRREKGRVDLAGKIPKPSQTLTPTLRKKVFIITTAVILLLVLIGANFYLGIAAKERRYTMLKGEMRRVFKEAFPEVRGVVNELQQAREMVRGMGERGVKISSHRGYTPLKILREIAQRLPEGTKIVELDMDEGRVALRGMAPSFAMVDEVKSSLAASALFQDVKVGKVELARRGGKGVLFRMVLAREEK
ncbi:MAG: pilus assembly protein PilM [Deltaproteobacteria bacterium]|nr:pilus assembly protein PilM [Deltaproteobacteria bacterium]